MKKFNLAILFFAISSMMLMVYYGCKKDDDSSSNNSLTTTLTIKVTDKNSNPVGGAEVSSYNKEGTTGSDGLLTLIGVSFPESEKNRMIIKIIKDGYFEASIGTKPNGGSETYFEAVLTEAELSGTIDNSSGGIVTNNGGSIFMDFPPNSLQYTDGTPYSGEANIYTAYYTPDDQNFALSMPGGPDMAAVNSTGELGSMISFGAISVEAKTPDMKSLQLTGLKSSNVAVNSQIANSMLEEAPATIPIWRLNEETAVWEEIGTATKQGNRYEYEVDHFSAINKDKFVNFDGALTLVKGDVCDDSLNPLPFARVDVWQRTVFTDEEGHFEVYLPSNRVYTFESEYCTISAGPFTFGGDNYVDLCCEGSQNQGFFRINVNGTFNGEIIADEDFEFTNFGYFFADTIIEGYNFDNVLYLCAGGEDQYWSLCFVFINAYNTISSTFTGTGNYSMAYPDGEVLLLGMYFPNNNPDEGILFFPNSGNININEYTQGNKMSGYFSMEVLSDGIIEGEFEIYELEIKKAGELKSKLKYFHKMSSKLKPKKIIKN